MEELTRLKILFLDDRSKRIHSALEKFKDQDLRIVTNVTECLRYLSHEDWGLVFLDHDLGGKEFCDLDDPTCGYQVVQYLMKTGWPERKPYPEFIVHSSNAFAATVMVARLRSIGFRANAVRWQYD